MDLSRIRLILVAVATLALISLDGITSNVLGDECATAREDLQDARQQRLRRNQEAREKDLQAIFERYRDKIYAELAALNQATQSRLKQTRDRSQRTTILEQHHKKRRQISSQWWDYHAEKRALNSKFSDKYYAINAKFRAALQQLVLGEDCNAVIARAFAEEESKLPPGFRDPTGQASTTLIERADELEAKVAESLNRERALRRDVERYGDQMQEMFGDMDRLMGKDGTDAAWQKTRQDIQRRLRDLVQAEADGVAPDLVLRRREYARYKALMKPLLDLESKINRTKVLHQIYRDALENHFDESLADEKQRLINRFGAIKQHRDGLGDLIDAERIRRQKTLDELDKIRSLLAHPDRAQPAAPQRKPTKIPARDIPPTN